MIRQLSRYLPKGSTKYHVAILSSGSALGQIIIILSYPLLTRLFTPESFGVFAVYTSIVGILTPVAGFRYELAIPLPRNNIQGFNLLALSLLCVFVSTALVSLFFFVFREDIPVWLNVDIGPYLFLVPAGVLIAGIYQSCNFWAVRRREFGRIARTRLQHGIGTAAAQILLGLMKTGSLGLILGHFIGKTVSSVALVTAAFSNDRAFLAGVRPGRMRRLAIRHRRFPLFTTWAALANACSTMLPPILLAAMFTPAVAGLYMLAHRTLWIPVNLVAKSIGQVFHSKAAVAKNDGTLDTLMLRASKSLLRLSLVPLGVFGIVAPDVFGVVFGEEWISAGVYAQWIVPWLMMQCLVSPLSNIISVTESQFGGLLFQIFFLVTRIGSLFVGGWMDGASGAILYYCLSGVLVYALLWIWMLKLADISLKRWLLFAGKDIALSALIVASVAAVYYLFS